MSCSLRNLSKDSYLKVSRVTGVQTEVFLIFKKKFYLNIID